MRSGTRTRQIICEKFEYEYEYEDESKYEYGHEGYLQ